MSEIKPLSPMEITDLIAGEYVSPDSIAHIGHCSEWFAMAKSGPSESNGWKFPLDTKKGKELYSIRFATYEEAETMRQRLIATINATSH